MDHEAEELGDDDDDDLLDAFSPMQDHDSDPSGGNLVYEEDSFAIDANEGDVQPDVQSEPEAAPVTPVVDEAKLNYFVNTKQDSDSEYDDEEMLPM